MDVKRGVRLYVSFYEMFAASLWIDYVHISNEVSGCGGGDCCGYLLVQGGHDGIYPVYRKTKIGTFLLLLQERGGVCPVVVGNDFAV